MMRIAQVAPLYERVPPESYGGTERVVSYLTEELVRRGHHVTLFASGDSITAASLEATCPRSLRLDRRRPDPLASHMHMLTEVYRAAARFDLIHSHVDYLCLPFAHAATVPTLVTLHGRLDLPGLGSLYADYPDVPLVSISHAQRTPLADASFVATIHHGLPPNPHAFNPRPDTYLLFLGRISPEKCPDAAIRIAIRAGVRLRIAAKIDAVDERYFEEVVRPLLNHPLIEFVGEKGGAEKDYLLRNALALLFPIDWPEPFGLVMIEALACGTPIIARRRGSVPEVLRHGETGWLCETEDEMAAAVGRIGLLDRAACRAAFDRTFTAAAMTERYLAVYRQLVSRRPSDSAVRRHEVAARDAGGIPAACDEVLA